MSLQQTKPNGHRVDTNGETHKANQECAQSVDEVTARNIRTIAQLEEASKSDRTRGDRVADVISGFCGSMSFVYFHIVWFFVWITLNVGPILPKGKRFDPYPFQFLTLVVSLEAIFLSAFIMISQNRQSIVDQRRNHLDLQVNLLSEQENSKALAMLESILNHLGIPDSDPEISILEENTRPDEMINQIKNIIEKGDCDPAPPAK